MKTKFSVSQLVILGLMTAILLLMAYTPLGYLNIGPLAITFNVIPVAISAITLGPVGGAIAGAVFGLTSSRSSSALCRACSTVFCSVTFSGAQENSRTSLSRAW